MRSTLKFAVPLAVAALALGACGTKGGETPSPAAAEGLPRPLPATYKIGMFGPLTGPNANLGIYIQNGVNLALDDYNKTHADCKVTLENYDSQGDPTQAPALAKKAIDDKKVVGIVGPAFSGESKAADPAFNEAGLVTITPSATARSSRPTAGRPSSARSVTTTSRALPRRSTSRTPSRRTRRSSSTTRPSTARAWPTSSATTSGRRSSATTRSSRSRPTSAPRSPR